MRELSARPSGLERRVIRKTRTRVAALALLLVLAGAGVLWFGRGDAQLALLEAMGQLTDRVAQVFGSGVPLFADAVGLDEGTLGEATALPEVARSADELAVRDAAPLVSTPGIDPVGGAAPETNGSSTVAIAALSPAGPAEIGGDEQPISSEAPTIGQAEPQGLGLSEAIWADVATVDATFAADMVDRPMSLEAALTAPDALARLGVPTGRIAQPLAKPPAAKEISSPVQPDDDTAPFAVQLASYRSEQLAAQAADKLTDAHLGPLQTGSAQVVPGPNGLFRVMSARMERRDDAAALCEQLKSRGQDCLVVQRFSR